MYKQEQEGTPEKWWRARKTSKGYRLAEPWPETQTKISNDFNDLAKDLERTRLTVSFVNDFKDLHTDDLAVVVELDRSSVAVEQAPPNPSSAVVVADL